MKKFICMLLAVAAAAMFTCTFASCKDGGDETEAVYTVYVKDADGNAAAGADVMFCRDTFCDPPVTTDEEGKVVVKKAVGEKYEIHAVAGDYSMHSATVETSGKTSTYTLVLDQEGDYIAG